MHPVRSVLPALAGLVALVAGSAHASGPPSTITFYLTGTPTLGGMALSSSATFGGQTYTLAFSSNDNTFETDATLGLTLSPFSFLSASVGLTAPAGKQLLFTGYRQSAGYNLAAGSSFDFGTSTGNSITQAGWIIPFDYIAQGTLVLGNSDIVTFTNKAIFGGVNSNGRLESLTFQVQSVPVPAPLAAPAAAVLLAIAGPRGRRRR
jgi:hypothetical protein